jgi:DNA replication and repair protein RecF
MFLSKLDIFQVRNLQAVQLSCHPQANIIYGANGSGKTSLLESIYLLGRGRSFRHRDLRVVVSREADELVVSGDKAHIQRAVSGPY